MSLEELRKRIDEIDYQLVQLLNERARVVVEDTHFLLQNPGVGDLVKADQQGAPLPQRGRPQVPRRTKQKPEERGLVRRDRSSVVLRRCQEVPEPRVGEAVLEMFPHGILATGPASREMASWRWARKRTREVIGSR